MTSKILNFVRHIFLNSSVSGYGSCLKKMSVVEATLGMCKCEITVENQNTNRSGTLHGGFTALLVDEVTILALLTQIQDHNMVEQTASTSSVDLNVSYMSPARLGDTLVIEAHTEKVGKTLAFITAKVTQKENGRIVARGTHTKILPRQ